MISDFYLPIIRYPKPGSSCVWMGTPLCEIASVKIRIDAVLFKDGTDANFCRKGQDNESDVGCRKSEVWGRNNLHLATPGNTMVYSHGFADARIGVIPL